MSVVDRMRGALRGWRGMEAAAAEGARKTVALPAVLSLSGLQVTSATASALTVDAGVDPPDGGGFEVRRSDANFGSASTADLVLSSPVRGFSIPRAAFSERFFVRIYDGATPRNYSPLSSVVMTSLPTS